jgi:predicted O-methyltransferase YrrM
LADGYDWIQNYLGEKFDLIFADAMPGKYELFEETIGLVKEADSILLMTCYHNPIGQRDTRKKLKGS